MALWLPLLLAACATPENKVAVPERPQVHLEELKTKCENEGHALSCARYGYYTKDLSYTRYACSLGDQTSCFNVREVENRAPTQNFNIIESNKNQIFGCYINHSIDTDMGEGIKEDKKVDLVFVIDTAGKISSLSIQGEKISQKFKSCVMNAFASKKFVASDREQSIIFTLLMPKIKHDKRLDKKPGLLD